MNQFKVNSDITDACIKFNQAFQILLLIRKCSNIRYSIEHFSTLYGASSFCEQAVTLMESGINHKEAEAA
ncbi:hypothetical protein [Paraglaciecola sp.]|uniref:hypothetical protein n=1 Tax=Paraglaciecola sp. TaxID=1920173 RepID=UPI003EF6DCF5